MPDIYGQTLTGKMVKIKQDIEVATSEKDGLMSKEDKVKLDNMGESAKGDPGQGVESTVLEFYLSTSKTTQTGGSWVTDVPTWEYGKYLWQRFKITYRNPSEVEYTKPFVDSSWEYSVARFG